MIIQYFKTFFFNKNKLDENYNPKIVEDHRIDRYIEKYSNPISKTSIDAITWHDLELNKVYNKVNYTFTTIGKISLFNYMMHPNDDEKSYNERIDKIDKMATLDQTSIKKSLNTLGNFNGEFDSTITPTIMKIKLKWMLLISGLWGLSVLIWPILLYFTLPAILLFLVIFHYSLTSNNKVKIDNLSYLVKIGLCYLEIEEATSKISDGNVKLNKFSHDLMQARKALCRMDGLNYLEDIQQVVTVNLYRSIKIIDKILDENQDLIQPLIDRVGEIDVLQSICKFKDSSKNFTSPILKDSNTSINAINIRNILLDNSVGNNIDLNKSMIITGSNMSGKSTLLRTLGTNVILAQSFGVVFSDSFESGFFKITSAISLKDNISENKSYFIVEAECIMRMLALSSERNKHLFLIDEIFKGTNPSERLASAVEILNALTINQKTIATTHDIEILPDLVEYNKFYFEHEVFENKLRYNYQLSEGVSDIKNAIKLMASIGYPEEIINNIYSRMESNQYS